MCLKNTSFSILPNLLPKDDPRYQNWLKSLKRRPPPWNKNKTKETDLGVKRISDTFRTKKIDNFSKWRDEARKNGLIPRSDLPLLKTKDLAFLIGIILGDGYMGKTPRTEVLRITLGTDKPLLWQHVLEKTEKMFDKKPNLHKRKKSACVDIRIYQNNLSKRLGIPLGPKRQSTIKLPAWIWNNNGFLIMALKGLFEAEGSFSIHLPTYTYNFSFSNINQSLLNEVEKGLLKLGFHPERRSNAVRLRRKLEALAFQALINFRRYV